MAITQNTYTGDGATVLFSFTFPYLQEADIKITLDGTPTTAYTLANPTTIQFNTAPGNNVAIRIYRDTDIDTLSAEFFPGSAIRAEDLNNNYTQNNYAVQEAKREADAAVTTSSSALSIVNSVVSYDPVVNVAAIPAAPSDGDRIEVLDSTGIESYTPLSGVPSGFIGASTLTVRLIYSVTTWVWQDYQSTDPDARYLKQLSGFRNVLINGKVSINQRGVTYAATAVGDYWADRWKKTAGGMTQIVEDGNYQPSTQYTLSGTGVTTQQITSPASGDWTIPDVPATATNIQLEPGPVATPFEHRPIGTELALCQRYFVSINPNGLGPVNRTVYVAGRTKGNTIPIPPMRAQPAFINSGSGNQTVILLRHSGDTPRVVNVVSINGTGPVALNLEGDTSDDKFYMYRDAGNQFDFNAEL